jgi:hypothetical protein
MSRDFSCCGIYICGIVFQIFPTAYVPVDQEEDAGPMVMTDRADYPVNSFEARQRQSTLLLQDSSG